MHGYIQGIEDIAIVGPILKELMDVGVKNDDNLLKLATVIQRIMNKQADVTEETSLLSEDEKEELMNALEDMSGDLQKKSDELTLKSFELSLGFAGFKAINSLGSLKSKSESFINYFQKA